ncbi:MAG: S-layer homology domain-containing protein [Lachnospiraceae bacterium]|nr:S-layer homology domain-containing protein [Lachnospiraceae bacterium]
MKLRKSLKTLLITTAAAAMAVMLPFSSFAKSYSLKSSVVNSAGIMDTAADNNQYVTRSDFAKMLILASKYRDVLTTTSNISIFADVPAGNENASAIRLCAENGWMSAYLGGRFKPDQAVTMSEAEKGLLGLLGYKNTDFPGDQYNMRHAKAASISLTEDVEKTLSDPLTRSDCISLFYNLLRCKTTDNRDYVSVLGGTLASDGEVNATSFAQGSNSLKGPKFFHGNSGHSRLTSWLPFAGRDGSTYINGELSSWDTLVDLVEGDGAVCYYNAASKTVWAYSCDGSGERGGKSAYRGVIEGVEYNGPDTLTPTAVQIDGNLYKLTTTDMQYAFSIYGSCKVGETVTVIYTVGDDAGNYTGTVVDYIYED